MTLPLELFREQISYHPYHFWGIAGANVPVESKCNTVVKKYSWQATQAAGRQDIIANLEFAEERIRKLLGYNLLPHYVEETLQWPQYYDPAMQNITYAGSDGRWLGVKLREGLITAAGTEKLTLIGSAVVTYSDVDGDGVNDTFTTAAVVTSITDPAQIAVYFSSADRLNAAPAGAEWQISPIFVDLTTTPGSVIVKGRSWLCVKPLKYEGVNANALDNTVAANFVSTLDIYSAVTEVNGQTLLDAQAVLTWETLPYPSWAFPYPFGSGATSDPAATATAFARVALHDAERGIVGIGEAVYNASLGQWISPGCFFNCGWRPPDRVTVRYLAGVPYTGTKNLRPAGNASKVLSRLALAEMMKRICACDEANREIYRWQTDLAFDNGETTGSFKLSPADLANPLGTRAGQIDAWRNVVVDRQLSGVLA